jgi:hypothetical protein
VSEELESQIEKKKKYLPKNKPKLEVTLQDIINNIKTNYYEDEDESGSSKTSIAIKSFCCSSILTDYGTEPENLSGWYFDQDEEPKGGNAFLLPSYTHLIEYLLSLFSHSYVTPAELQNANFTYRFLPNYEH